MVVLHIGPHKTATTHMQWGLWAMRQYLLDHGVWFDVPPRMGANKNIDPAHHFFVRCLHFSCKEDDGLRASRFVESIESASSDGRHVILSSEEARSLPVRNLRLLHGMLKSFSVKAVYVYRDFFSWLYSDYRQLLLVKVTRDTFSKFRVQRSSELREELFRSVENYLAVFGHESMHILDFWGSCSVGDILNVMLSAVSLPPLPEPIEAASPKGLEQDEVVLRQAWAEFERFMYTERNCTMQWPQPLQMHTKVPQIVLNATEIPTVCPATQDLKDLALRVDNEFRAQFGERILHGRPDLTKKVIDEFHVVCEADLSALRGSSWKSRFEQQASALPEGACVSGRLDLERWESGGRL